MLCGCLSGVFNVSCGAEELGWSHAAQTMHVPSLVLQPPALGGSHRPRHPGPTVVTGTKPALQSRAERGKLLLLGYLTLVGVHVTWRWVGKCFLLTVVH